MVVGAGRGPLVRASLRASAASNRPLRVYAVEKNPNAVVTYVLCARLLSACVDSFRFTQTHSNRPPLHAIFSAYRREKLD